MTPRRTGTPHHLRQARYDARRALALDVQQLGIETAGKSIKQVRIAVARVKAAHQSVNG